MTWKDRAGKGRGVAAYRGRVAALAIAAAVLIACAASAWRAPEAGAASESARQATAGDAQLKEFLQKRFRIPDAKAIVLSPPSPAPIPGLWTRAVTVTSDQGMKVNATLFTDSTGSKVILGQFLDTKSDPWGRVDLKKVHLDDRPSVGPAEAPVTVIEFGDFQCPFCARALNILETMVHTTYSGRVRLFFKNYPLSGHLWATAAATAAECVRLQNPETFWDFARDLYKDQAAIDPKNIRQHIDDYAKSLKLDTDALSKCMMSKAPSDRIQQDMQDASMLRVSSTPTFFVNGIPVVGFTDAKALGFVIDSELASNQAAAGKP